jgi:hypothetical protein
MAQYKTQHYVPKCYLERFCDPDTDKGKQPSLWVLQREGRLFRRSPKKVAAKSYYYSYVDDKSTLHNEPEHYLSQIEGRADAVVEKLVQGSAPSDLLEDDRKHLALFIAFMGLRVPRFRTHWERQLGEVMKMTGQVAASDREYFEKTIRQMKDMGLTKPDLDVDKLRQFILSGEYDVTGSPGLSLRIMFDMASPIARYIYEYNWRLLRSAPDSNFVTSDAPLTLVSTKKLPPPFGWSVGWESPWMEALLPLSPRVALLVSQHHPTGEEEVSSAKVLEANRRTEAHAGRELYCSKRIELSAISIPPEWDWWQPLSDVVLPYYMEESGET